mgnify:FL=1
MNPKNKRTLFLTSTICIILSIVAFALSHMGGASNENYILLYVIAVLLNIVLNLALNIKIASTNGAKALVSLGKWIMPIAGVVYLIPQVYSVLFPAKTMQDTYWYVFIGILFIVSGNYFPKNHINPYVGLKFPWLFNDEEGWYKKALDTDLARPKFAIMNPEITYTLPDYQTQCGCADIMMHTMERYFVLEDTMEITDKIAQDVMKNVMKYAKILKKGPENYEARAEIMWCGSLSHNGLTGCGTCGGDWATYLIEHELGGMFDVAHGAGLAAVWGSWARYVMDEKPERFAQFAVDVMGVEESDDVKSTALKGIEAVEEFYRMIEMPTNMKELGI